jgi:hypothetical protein
LGGDSDFAGTPHARPDNNIDANTSKGLDIIMATRRKRNSGAKRGQGGQENKKPGRWTWLNTGIVVASVGAVGAVIAAIITVVIPHFFDGTPPPAPNLEVDSVTGQVGATQTASLDASIGGNTGYETLDFKVRNTGNQLALVDAVRITIQSYSVRTSGVSGSFLPVSATYVFPLPLQKGVFTAQVSEEVAPDQADRFDLIVSLPKNTLIGTYTYHLGFALVYDKGNSVNAGYMTVSLSARSAIETIIGPKPSTSPNGS